MMARKMSCSYPLCFLSLCLLCAPGSSGQVRGVPNSEPRAHEEAPNPVARNASAPSSSISARESWLPPDIDRVVPPVGSGVACSLPAVLQGAGQRIQELVKNVDRFTATEVLSHQEVDRSGKPGRPVTVKFDYLVSMTESHDGYMTVDELRDRGRSLERFPAHIATTGTPSLVLIFHPHYVTDFKMNCEGLGEWHSQPAWQVRFEQRADRMNRTCTFVVDGRAYDARLRGRAWILANSFQVARLETDLIEAIPKIRLRTNHESIEYSPVSFSGTKQSLWLPSSVELYMDFRGHRFYRKHAFTNFLLFSVDTQSQVGQPKGDAAVR
jgi:hypothetical protein